MFLNNLIQLIKSKVNTSFLVWWDVYGPFSLYYITGVGALKKYSKGQNHLKNMELYRKTLNFLILEIVLPNLAVLVCVCFLFHFIFHFSVN